jgi:hypothetical protein
MAIWLPPDRPIVDRPHPLATGLRYIATMDALRPVNLVNAQPGGAPSATVKVVSGSYGRALRLTASSGENATLAPDASKLFRTDRCTIAVIRRKVDTTARNSEMLNAFSSGTSLINVHGPWSDGKIYWDFANSSVGSGRVSTGALTFDADLDAYVFVAGPRTGRAIWRRGKLLVSNTAANASFTSVPSVPFMIGGWNSGISDNEEIYGVWVWNEELSDGQISSWFADPWQMLREDDSYPLLLHTSTPLIGADAIAGGSATDGNLIQIQGLTGGAAVGGASATAGALDQVQAHAAAAASGAGTAASGALAQTQSHAADSASTGGTAEAGAITQPQIHTAADAVGGIVATGGTLVSIAQQTHTASDSSGAATATAGTLTQVQSHPADVARCAGTATGGALAQVQTHTAADAQGLGTAMAAPLTQVQSHTAAAALGTPKATAGALGDLRPGLGPIIHPTARNVTPRTAARAVTRQTRARLAA